VFAIKERFKRDIKGISFVYSCEIDLLLTSLDEKDRLVLDQSKEIQMDSVGAYEAKTQLSKLLERVMKGERITITKHGVPVAILQPPDPGKSGDIKTVIFEIFRYRDKHSLKGYSLKDLIEEGRR
jgi:prevent-host-death family protein